MKQTMIRRNAGPLTFKLADLLDPIGRTLAMRRMERELSAAAEFALTAKRVTANARKRELLRARKGMIEASMVAKRLGAKVA